MSSSRPSSLVPSLARSLSALWLVVLLAVALSACGTDPASEEPGVEPASAVESPPPNILLITVDTLRADRLSTYGHVRETSPNLDRLAAEGVRFDRANVQWPKTGPSFTSIFTSTYPSQNGIVRHVGLKLPCAFRMLAEELQQLGYSNHAVVSNGAVASELHFDQGFESYVETWKIEPAPEDPDPSTAAGVTNLAIEALDRLEDGKPYFLWVHYLDPHFPYEPPGEWRDLYQDDEHFEAVREIPIAKNYDQQVAQLGYNRVLDERTDLGFYLARYDAEIAYTDHEIARLLETMRGRGLLGGGEERDVAQRDTVTVVTSDHGESLGEHYYYFDHGRFGFQTCVHVPLIVHAPGRLEARVVERPVELVDLAPTLLEIAGASLADGAWAQGQSLLPVLRGEEDPRIASTTEPGEATESGDPVSTSSLAFSEAGYADHGRWQRIVQDPTHKLVYARSPRAQPFLGGEGVPLVLYDLTQDPGETVNVAEQQPEVFEHLRRQLWDHVNAEPFEVRVEPETCADTSGLDAETEAQLRALGYL